MEHSLLAVEFRDWWEDAACIASKKYDVCRMIRGHARDFGIADELNRVCTGFINMSYQSMTAQLTNECSRLRLSLHSRLYVSRG